jgi:hypothetical protein
MVYPFLYQRGQRFIDVHSLYSCFNGMLFSALSFESVCKALRILLIARRPSYSATEMMFIMKTRRIFVPKVPHAPMLE